MGKDFLEIARRNLAILEKTATSEQDVKRLIVEPIMIWAGIDIYDPNTLREEFSIRQVKSKTKADYAVLVDGNPKIAVEAKNLREKLGFNLKQLIDYCNYGDIKFGLITNGKAWWFVDEAWKSSNERVFLKVELNSEYVELIKLMNPLFFDILEKFASDYEKILDMDFKYQDTFERSLFSQTMNDIRERILKKESESKVFEPSPQEKTDDEFINLSEFLEFTSKYIEKNLLGIEAPKIVIVNNEKIKANSWQSIFIRLIESSYKKIKIPLKLSEPNERYIINTKKVHSTGKPMTTPYEINDNGETFYVEKDWNSPYIFRIIKRIKEVANLQDDYIKFPADWFEKAKLHVEERKNKNARS